MNNKVQVCVRCRPLHSREVYKGHFVLSSDRVLVKTNEAKEYVFDKVFGETSTQSDIFDSCIENLVEGCFEGYNATVFACKCSI